MNPGCLVGRIRVIGVPVIAGYPTALTGLASGLESITCRLTEGLSSPEPPRGCQWRQPCTACIMACQG
jgi:hypothetical protein